MMLLYVLRSFLQCHFLPIVVGLLLSWDTLIFNDSNQVFNSIGKGSLVNSSLTDRLTTVGVLY